MGFLDNSGDIILDAVLTDTGRYRLAQGNGSFKITKFALGDDEINYGEYNKNHPSGSAYYDLEILQTPVLEAFTNNTSTMKSKLISIPRTNLLYLPVVQSNTGSTNTNTSGSTGVYAVGVNRDTVGYGLSGGVSGVTGILIKSDGSEGANTEGVLNGFQATTNQEIGPNYILVAQGLNTEEIPRSTPLDSDLVETQFIVEMDNRFGYLVSETSDRVVARPSFIDDDNIASYYFSTATDTQFTQIGGSSDDPKTSNLSGPGGSYIQLRIQASSELRDSNYLFEQLGSTGTMKFAGGADADPRMDIRFIDTTIKITGATTGASTDLAIRYVRKQS